MSYLDLAKDIFDGNRNTFGTHDVGGSRPGVSIRIGTYAKDADGNEGVALDGSVGVLPMAWAGSGVEGARVALVSDGGTTLAVNVDGDWVVSRVQHSSRDAIVTTWASGRVEVNGTITKNHSGSTSQDQLPSITEFKADATYNKSLAAACNGDFTAKQFFVTGCGIRQDGSVFCGISTAYTGAARINYYYDLR